MLAQTIANDERFTSRLAGDFACWCIELAKHNHLDGTARLERMGAHTIEFTVPSRSRDREYSAIANHAGTVWCTCTPAKHNRPCSHAGAVYHYLRQLAQARREYAEPVSIPARLPQALPPVRTLQPEDAAEWDSYQVAFMRDLEVIETSIR